MTDATNKQLDAWIKHLSGEDMPVFSGTVADVTEAVNSEDSSASEVAQTILRDASLTSRLLKIANNFSYNPTGQKISTISRAVMLLGFEQVGALTLTLVLVDSLADGLQRDKLTEEMAQSFHAAIQAQELAKRTKCKSPEDIFIAALLARLGNMAFWAFSGDKANELMAMIETGELTEQQAEQQVLGFRLSDLTKGLSKSWSLGELLEKSTSPDSADERYELISLGHDLAEAAKSGWDSKEVTVMFEHLAKKLGLPIKEVEELVHNNAKQAKEISQIYGVTEASKRIPQPGYALIDSKASTDTTDTNAQQPAADLIEPAAKNVEPVVNYPEPDPHLQLSIMQEISTAVEEKPSINIILEMVLEGLHQGVGMDRALFAILAPDRKTLTCKYGLGAETERLCSELHIDVTNEKNIFHQVISSKQAMHVPADPKKITGTLSRETLKLLGTPPYLIMPAIVRGRVIGVFLADRNASEREIYEQDFIAFQQFCQQANMGLTFLTM